MTKRKSKPEPKPTPPAADIASDHSATLARDTLVTSRGELPPAVFALKGVPCPTCGTAKLSNRCEVCGHQEHDT